MSYHHQEWPRWMYRDSGGDEPEGRIFDKPEDVPKDEGWVISPDLVGASKSQIAAATRKSKKAHAAVEEAEDD